MRTVELLQNVRKILTLAANEEKLGVKKDTLLLSAHQVWQEELRILTFIEKDKQ